MGSFLRKGLSRRISGCWAERCPAYRRRRTKTWTTADSAWHDCRVCAAGHAGPRAWNDGTDDAPPAYAVQVCAWQAYAAYDARAYARQAQACDEEAYGTPEPWDDVSASDDGRQVSDEACRKIVNDYSMEAYDEQLDYYAEKAMDEASNEYEELIKNSESTIRDALENLDCII